jgi:hypothetical protein
MNIIRRNRRKRLHWFAFPVRYAGLVVLGSVVALSYVWLGCRCESLGREIRTLEIERDQLKKELLNEESRWSKMKSPGSIEEALDKHKIVMTWPRRDQVVRLDNREAAGAPSNHNKLNGLPSYASVRREKAVIHD